MKLLLDTHCLLWWLDDPSVIAVPTRKLISDPRNDIFISAAVIWEIAIKQSIGKLTVIGDVDLCIAKSNFNRLPIAFEHAWFTKKLPMIHKDPFDRILIAQAMVESATIVTRDANIPLYGVPYELA